MTSLAPQLVRIVPMHSTRAGPAGARTALGTLARHLLRALASLRLAVVLLVLLGLVLSVATALEAVRGREYAQWYVYGSRWFMGLLGLLGANVAAAMAVRWPWRRRQAGFLVAHLGLLLLLAGAMQTLLGGIEGQLILAEGQSADAMSLVHRSQIRVLARQEDRVESMEFGFSPGPVDWPADKRLEFSTPDGVCLSVRRFLRHGRPERFWIEDPSGQGKPAVLLASSSGDGRAERWYTSSLLAGPVEPGQLSVWVQEAPQASLVADFLSPPPLQPNTRGVLSVHYSGQMQRIEVDAHLGKKVDLQSGLAVELVAYYPDARIQGKGQFYSAGEKPQNPMLQLRVFLPDRKEPLPEVAYANNPFVSFESMRGRPCPVKFWYHHPATAARPGVEFLQTPEGKLYCRVGQPEGYAPRGEVRPGDRIAVPPWGEVEVVRHVPHARQEIAFVAGTGGEEAASGEAAVLIQLDLPDKSQQFWLRRDDLHLGVRRIESAQGPMLVLFGYESYPLGFSLQLRDFQRGLNPGGTGEASFASQVRVSDPRRSPFEAEISMNRPLNYGGLRFYQSGYRPMPDGREVSILAVSRDPGRLLKYTGSAMICLGIAVMLVIRRREARTGKEKPGLPGQNARSAAERLASGGEATAAERATPPQAHNPPVATQPPCESPPGSLLSPLT